MRPLLTPDEVADLLGVPPRTLSDWRHRSLGPPWLRVGRHARYPAEPLDQWIASGVERATGDHNDVGLSG